jgi:2-haloacid dehalogenase
MDFSRFTTISFDCYGTLINWEAGILPTMERILAHHGRELPAAEILKLYGEFEVKAEAGEYQTYRKVLESVVAQFGERLRFQPSAAEMRSLADSVPSWPAFPDTVAALRELKRNYRLAIISNIDDELFAETRKLLGVEFDSVTTAGQARSYKPSLNNFQLAMRSAGVGADKLLHVGQSIYHDVLPAQSLGIATVWVNRASARPGVGAVIGAEGKPDLEVKDLVSLSAAMGAVRT